MRKFNSAYFPNYFDSKICLNITSTNNNDYSKVHLGWEKRKKNRYFYFTCNYPLSLSIVERKSKQESDFSSIFFVNAIRLFIVNEVDLHNWMFFAGTAFQWSRAFIARKNI